MQECEMEQRPQSRRLQELEIAELLAMDIPAHLATLSANGYPRITPIWFVWEDGCFYMTSLPMRRHLEDLRLSSRAGLCVDEESVIAIDGVRPNRQVNAWGDAELREDIEGYWTKRITRKYIIGADAAAIAERRAASPRLAIVLRPSRMIAVGTSKRFNKG
jgi:pyridoxamine 5'-phosphate oxidase-like protein